MKSFLQISSKSQYALRMLAYIASSGGVYVSLSEVAKKEGISHGYLEEIVAPLKKNGVLESKGGRSGGYKLAKGAEKVNIADILRIFEGKIAPVKCLGIAKCPKQPICKTQIVWKKLKDSVDRALGEMKLSDIL